MPSYEGDPRARDRFLKQQAKRLEKEATPAHQLGEPIGGYKPVHKVEAAAEQKKESGVPGFEPTTVWVKPIPSALDEQAKKYGYSAFFKVLQTGEQFPVKEGWKNEKTGEYYHEVTLGDVVGGAAEKARKIGKGLKGVVEEAGTQIGRAARDAFAIQELGREPAFAMQVTPLTLVRQSDGSVAAEFPRSELDNLPDELREEFARIQDAFKTLPVDAQRKLSVAISSARSMLNDKSADETMAAMIKKALGPALDYAAYVQLEPQVAVAALAVKGQRAGEGVLVVPKNAIVLALKHPTATAAVLLAVTASTLFGCAPIDTANAVEPRTIPAATVPAAGGDGGTPVAEETPPAKPSATLPVAPTKTLVPPDSQATRIASGQIKASDVISPTLGGGDGIDYAKEWSRWVAKVDNQLNKANGASIIVSVNSGDPYSKPIEAFVHNGETGYMMLARVTTSDPQFPNGKLVAIDTQGRIIDVADYVDLATGKAVRLADFTTKGYKLQFASNNGPLLLYAADGKKVVGYAQDGRWVMTESNPLVWDGSKLVLYKPTVKEIAETISSLSGDFGISLKFNDYITTKSLNNKIIITRGGVNGFTDIQAQNLQEWLDWSVGTSPDVIAPLVKEADIGFIANLTDKFRTDPKKRVGGPDRFGYIWGVDLSTFYWDDSGYKGAERGYYLGAVLHEIARIVSERRNPGSGLRDNTAVHAIEVQMGNSIKSLLSESEQFGLKASLGLQ